ncbi:MAG: vWA domain-containing protein [Patescibacteria group bacterium]
MVHKALPTGTGNGLQGLNNNHLPLAIVQQMLENVDKPKTLSILIVDESGSMDNYGRVPQDCVNNHFRGLQNPPDGRQQYCTVILFNDRYRVAVPLTEASHLRPMTTYKAEGNTLLYETVHQVLKLFISCFEQSTADLKVFVGVFSDGLDTKSDANRQPKKVQVTSHKARMLGWELFSYGIGIDAKELARLLGFPTDKEHVHNFTAEAKSVGEATRHFTGRSTTVIFNDPQHFNPGTK